MLRPKLNRLWAGASSTARKDPGDAKYIQGWISEIPTFQVLNYLQYKMDATMLSLAERGFFEWGSDITYAKGALVWDETDKQVYIAQVAGASTTLRPSANAAQWKTSSIQITRQQYDLVVSNITTHIADVTGNPHQLTPGRLGAYTKAETDALIAQYRALVKTHVDDVNNPHGTTAAQIGAVPVTGGTYTGDVVFATGRVLLDAASTNKVGLLSGSGLYLQSGVGLLGLTTAGVAVAGTTTSQSNIITELTFADQKAAVEPDYAIPAPVFFMPLMGDTNIYIGSGTTDFPNALAWNQYGFQMMIGVGGVLSLSAHPLNAVTDTTVAIDFFGTGSNSSTQLLHIGLGVGTGVCRIGFDGTGRALGYFGGTTLASSNKFDAKPHRAVLRRTAAGATLFVDGVQVATNATATSPIVSNTECLNVSTTLTSAASLTVSNFRVWGSALTDKQISNL